MQAEIEVLTVINGNTTKEVEARNHLIGGIESALKKRFDVTIIIVLGKSHDSETAIRFSLKVSANVLLVGSSWQSESFSLLVLLFVDYYHGRSPLSL